ncbi:MAG: S46 family peptidase [Planctomycetes bacterium]|nr:S46 family peptidase [Planctomycetota bacterium]
MRNHRLLLMGLIMTTLTAPTVHADEGMWLPNRLPSDHLKATYGFEPTAQWIDHVRKSCIRFGRGGSASFVSPNGLIMTNHHVGATAIAKLSDSKHDYLHDGFYAQTRDGELSCEGLELFTLAEIRDVSKQIHDAIKPGMSPAEASAARDAVKSQIEQDATKETQLQPEIVTLYGGRQYHLYLYKKYTDIRLVFAPEQGIAFFGGDISNFEYPRYDLDVSFFRAYENGKPAKTEHFLQWSADGVSENDLVFVVGHPYRTQRIFTTSHLKLLRDVEIPMILSAYNQLEVELIQFRSEGAEHHRIGTDPLFGVQNGRKAFGGILAGLFDSHTMAQKEATQKSLQSFVQTDETRVAKWGDPWGEIEAAIKKVEDVFPAYYVSENRRMRMPTQFHVAKHLVRMAEELKKPDAERLSEYRDSKLDSIKRSIISTGPIYPDLEQLILTDALTRMGRVLGGDHAIVKAALGGQRPADRAAAILAGCKLGDQTERQRMLDGGSEAIAGSKDSMILFAKLLDGYARPLREQVEDEWESVEAAAYTRIAEAMYAKDGESVYPDATGTLRFSFGTVKSYTQQGKTIPHTTNIGGAFDLSREFKNAAPFNLPESWLRAEKKLSASTPFNYVSTCDIIGGNSGSPTVNRNGEIVGIIFDGNIQALIWDIQFEQEQARGVHVDSRAIIEALSQVYNAKALVSELQESKLASN